MGSTQEKKCDDDPTSSCFTDGFSYTPRTSQQGPFFGALDCLPMRPSSSTKQQNVCKLCHQDKMLKLLQIGKNKEYSKVPRFVMHDDLLSSSYWTVIMETLGWLFLGGVALGGSP